MKKTLLSAAAFAALSICAAGCVSVAPYERDYIAKSSMDTDRREEGLDRFERHVWAAREGAMPPGEAAGGGCGCN